MPMEHDLNLHHLELFHTVVREGSISAAANRLGTSQPSVSRQIRDLEERAGIPLLERLPRGIRTTEAGNVLFEHAREIFALRDKAKLALRDRTGLAAGILSIGASQTIGTYLLPKMLGDFHAQHPGPELRFEIGNTARIEERIREGWLDLGLVEGGSSSDFLKGHLGSEELLVVSSREFLREKIVPRNLAGVCHFPLILRESGAGSRQFLERTFQQRKISPNIISSLETAESIVRFVEAGLGISILPRSVVKDSLSRGHLVEIPVKDARLELRFEWILTPGRPVSPTTARFLASLGLRKPSIPVGETRFRFG